MKKYLHLPLLVLLFSGCKSAGGILAIPVIMAVIGIALLVNYFSKTPELRQKSNLYFGTGFILAAIGTFAWMQYEV